MPFSPSLLLDHTLALLLAGFVLLSVPAMAHGVCFTLRWSGRPAMQEPLMRRRVLIDVVTLGSVWAFLLQGDGFLIRTLAAMAG